MPSAHARIPTERASRYLTQLCRHLDQMVRMPHHLSARQAGQKPLTIDGVDWSDTAGTIRFSQGTCTLRASSHTLAVRIDADDQDGLRRLQDGITRRLDTIGRRDHLTVRWQPADHPPGLPSAEATPDAVDAARRAHRPGRALTMIGLAALAVVVHLGLLGGGLAGSLWASWGANVILAIIAVKAIVAGTHVVLGQIARRGLRRRRGVTGN